MKEIEEYQELQEETICQLFKTVENNPLVLGNTGSRDSIMNESTSNSTTSASQRDLDISYNSFLLSSPFGTGSSSSNSNTFDWLGSLTPQLHQSSSSVSNTTATVDPNVSMFERSFKKFLFIYNTMSLDARHDQIRKFLRNSVHKDLEEVNEFVRLLSETQVKNNSAPKSECDCTVCSYQTKLQQMEFEQFAFPGMDESDSSMSFYPNW